MNETLKNKNVKNWSRVKEFGEVNTNISTIHDMLQTVSNELFRIDSKFLEPACGDGNFLKEILIKKLEIIEKKYSKSQNEFEKFSLLACSSIYGIDILVDNIELAKKRLFEIFKLKYASLFKDIKNEVLDSFKFILSQNIVQGDALTFKSNNKEQNSVILPEWSLINNMFKRRDFKFKDVVHYKPMEGLNLFSDLGDEAFIPEPIKDYPLVNYLKIHESFSL
jgi:hypothetical protein